jgi:hypothetical protein
MRERILTGLAALIFISLTVDPAITQNGYYKGKSRIMTEDKIQIQKNEDAVQILSQQQRKSPQKVYSVCSDTSECYTIDRSRPEWLGEPTPVDRPPEEIPESRLPTEFSLEQSYPNPFNPTVSIKYALPQNAQVHLVIYNIFGRVVRTLLDEAKEAGYYTVTWDGRDDAGLQVASGIYFYRITAAHFAETKRMILLR